jgi:hypothetical protein
VLYSAEILVQLEKYSEAANQIIRITSGLVDIYGGVFLERAATLFGKSKMFRRQAFHSVLAGHRFEQSDLMQLAFQCYNKALPEYIDKYWTNAEDNGNYLNVFIYKNQFSSVRRFSRSKLEGRRQN